MTVQNAPDQDPRSEKIVRNLVNGLPRPLSILGLALCVAVIYSLPQIRYYADGYRYALLQSFDESPYAARVQDVIDGHWRAADPYVWETKTQPPLLPYGGEFVLGGIARMGGLSIDTTIISARFVAAGLLAILLARLLLVLTASMTWSVLGAMLLLLEPGTYYYKPFLYVTSLFYGWPDRAQLALVYARFHNPVVLAVPFLLAMLFLYKALLTERSRDLLMAGFLVALNFYTQLFYWAYLYAGMSVLLLVYLKNQQRRTAILKIGVVALAVGSYALFEQVSTFRLVDVQQIVPRAGLLLSTREPFFFLPKGLLLTSLAFALFHCGRDLRYFFLLSFLIGGYLLLNQNVLTGREIQNYHFHYANALVAGVATIVLCHAWVHSAWNRWPAAVQAAGVSLCVLWLVANSVALQAESYDRGMTASSASDGVYPSNLKKRFVRTLQWINASTPRDAVFLADADLSFLVPIYTHGNVFLNPLQNDHMASFMSDDELFERWVIHLKLQGLTPGEVFELVKHHEGAAILRWPFGRNRHLKNRYDLVVTPAFDAAVRSNRLAADYVAQYTQFPASEVLPAIQRYRVDYLLVSGGNQRFLEHTLTALACCATKMTAIPDEDVDVYRIAFAATRWSAR